MPELKCPTFRRRHDSYIFDIFIQFYPQIQNLLCLMISIDSYLLVVGGVSRKVGEVDELHVEGSELGQDAAAS